MFEKNDRVLWQIADWMQLLYIRRRVLRNQLLQKRGKPDAYRPTQVEAHVALELFTCGACSGSHLAQTLKIDKSTVSRTLAKLEREGLVEIAESKDDSRRKENRLTKFGRKWSQDTVRLESRVLAVLASELESERLLELKSLLSQACSCAGVAEIKLPTGVHPLLESTIRFLRLSGVEGSRHWGVDISSSEYRVLLMLEQFQGEMRASELKKALGLQSSRISRTVSRLAQRGLLKVFHRASDRREQEISLTESGRRKLHDVREKASRRLADCSWDGSSAELQRTLQSFETLLYSGDASATGALRRDFDFRQMVNEGERNQLRVFLVKQLAARSDLRSVAEHLFLQNSENFGLFADGELCGTCEGVIQHADDGTQLVLRNLVTSLDREVLVVRFANELRKRFFEDQERGTSRSGKLRGILLDSASCYLDERITALITSK